jgi:hypothetical protein
MAGHDDRKRIAGQCIAHGPDGTWLAKMGRQETVGADASPRDGVFGTQHGLLETRAALKLCVRQREANPVACERSGDARADRVNLCTARTGGSGKQAGGRGRCRLSRARQDDPADCRSTSHQRPENHHRTEACWADDRLVHTQNAWVHEPPDAPAEGGTVRPVVGFSATPGASLPRSRSTKPGRGAPAVFTVLMVSLKPMSWGCRTVSASASPRLHPGDARRDRIHGVGKALRPPD